MTVALAIVVVVIAAAAGYVFSRVVAAIRHIRREVRELPRIVEQQTTTLFHQLQAYETLSRILDLEDGLPPLRGWAASPDFLLVLVRHIRHSNPNRLVECGSGASTIAMARMLERNGAGHLYSLEHDKGFAARTRALLQQHNLEKWATVVDAPIVDGWYAPTSALPDAIEMLVVDGPPQESGPLARYPAVPRLADRLTSDAVVFLDDTVTPDTRETARRWQQEFRFHAVTHACEKGCLELRLMP